MKGLVFILLILAAQFIGVGVGFACGKKHATLVKSVLHTVSHRKACCSRHRHHGSCNSSKQCDHNCSQSGCDCAHSVNPVALKAQPTILVDQLLGIIDETTRWFFQQPAPKPVYLSLWEPPNISC